MSKDGEAEIPAPPVRYESMAHVLPLWALLTLTPSGTERPPSAKDWPGRHIPATPSSHAAHPNAAARVGVLCVLLLPTAVLSLLLFTPSDNGAVSP